MLLRNRRALGSIAVVVAGLLVALQGAPATASNSPKVTREVRDEICEQIKAQEVAKGKATVTAPCVAKETLTVGERKRLTPEIAIAQGDPLTPSGQRLSEVAAAATVYYQNWTQELRGFYYYNWYEKHQGLYYFDGTYAWVSPRYGWDAHGYHQCDLGYGVLYDVQVKECSVRGNLTATVVARDTFRVHVVWRGIPLYATHTMDAYLPKNGL